MCQFLVDETGVVVKAKIRGKPDQQAEVQEDCESVPSELHVDEVHSLLQQRGNEI